MKESGRIRFVARSLRVLSYPDDPQSKDLWYFALSVEYKTPQYLLAAEREGTVTCSWRKIRNPPSKGGCGVVYFLTLTRCVLVRRRLALLGMIYIIRMRSSSDIARFRRMLETKCSYIPIRHVYTFLSPFLLCVLFFLKESLLVAIFASRIAFSSAKTRGTKRSRCSNVGRFWRFDYSIYNPCWKFSARPWHKSNGGNTGVHAKGVYASASSCNSGEKSISGKLDSPL